MIRTPLWIVAAAVVGGAPIAAQALDTTGVSDTFSTLLNPRFKTFVRASSDPEDFPTALSKGNDDGFTGTNQVEDYRETEGASEYAVIAHLEGRPGYMGSYFRNFWGGLAGIFQLPWEDSRGQIFIEGQMLWDLPLSNYFRSPGNLLAPQITPFDGPFTQSRAGGSITYTPMVWENSFRLRVEENWFDNAARFHRLTGVLGTWDDVLEVPNRAEWETVYAARGGWPHKTTRVPTMTNLTIPGGGGSQTINLVGPSTLLEVSVTVTDPAHWDGLQARFTWDGQATPAVDVPVYVLGAMVRQPFEPTSPITPFTPITSLLNNNNGTDKITCYFPMHFTTSADLEFVNTNGKSASITVETAEGTGVHPEPWGYFHGTYDFGVTQTGIAFQGPTYPTGHGMLRYHALESAITNVPGVIPGNVSLMHIEGDMSIRTNNNKGDDHVYAATETGIGHWGWYDSPSDVPFQTDCSFHSGLLSMPLNKKQFETARLMGSTLVFDPVHYVDGIDIVLEHGPGNEENAIYRFTTFHYIAPNAARDTILELDVGDAADEATRAASFTEAAPEYELTHGFFRDTQFQTPDVTDDVRVIDTFFTFSVNEPNLTNYDAFCIGLRMDRDRGTGDGGIAQADVYVDGIWAGLLHSPQSNQWFRWKEGTELEVELPRPLTAGKTQFTVELRPRAGGDPFNLARLWLYGYP